MQISHEIIYIGLYVLSKNILGRDYLGMLRTGRRLRRCKTKTQRGGKHGPVSNGTSIAERPAAATGRAQRGHWERDLLTGNHGSYMTTFVDRKTRYTILVRLAGKQATAFTQALSRRMNRPPNSMKRSPAAHRREYRPGPGHPSLGERLADQVAQQDT